MLIFVLQEIFRITKKRRRKKKEFWGKFKAIQGSEFNFYEKFQFFLTMSISHIVILGPEKL